MNSNKVRINESILKGIKKNCEGDEILRNFLTTLLYEEASHPNKSWRWREFYLKNIKTQSEKWSGTNADWKGHFKKL